MPETDLDKRKIALNFLKAHRTGVLATISPEGTPRARLVYYACDDSFAISFLTLASTRKVDDLAANQHAAFTVAVEEVPQTIQMEGTVTDLTATGTIDATLSKLTENWLSNPTYEAPLTRLDSGGINYYRFTPTWIRWEDFTSGHKTADVLTIIPA
jgi:general stress protein 26